MKPPFLIIWLLWLGSHNHVYICLFAKPTLVLRGEWRIIGNIVAAMPVIFVTYRANVGARRGYGLWGHVGCHFFVMLVSTRFCKFVRCHIDIAAIVKIHIFDSFG